VGLVALMFGAGACALYYRVALAKQLAEADGWRTKYEAERLENSKYVGMVQQLAPLERERHELRARLESLTGDKSRLEAVADRVPALERDIAALNGELKNLSAANAALSTQVREQADAHVEKVAALTDVQ